MVRTKGDPERERIKQNIVGSVRLLSAEIGQRSYQDLEKLAKAASYIEESLRKHGRHVVRQPFAYNGNIYYNIISEVEGTADRNDGILVIGAHYDTVAGTPGADDNASGVAALLELARLIAKAPLRLTVRLAAFSLEEPPAFMTSCMGSYVYARHLSEKKEKVFGMISLEMLGYYADDKGLQYYPSSIFKLFYPDRGDFIAFVGNLSSRTFTKRVRDSFTEFSAVPVESLTGVSLIPGVDFSDHRSFWKFGFPAFMITDTAFYRNPHYHQAGDTPETLDYDRISEVVISLYRALARL